MSKMTGNATVAKEQATTSGKRFGTILGNVSHSCREVKHPLIEPDGIIRLSRPVKSASGERVVEVGRVLVFVAGHSVIRGRQILHFADPIFSRRSKLRPVSTDVVHEVPGQSVTTAPAPEDEVISQRGGFVVS